MNAKMYRAGLAGGILCALVFWYPLAEYLPSLLLKEWPATNAGLGWGLSILAGVIVLVSGAAAARMSGTTTRFGSTFSGAISGLIAILVAYILVGGAAAGTWGARPILEFGLKSAPDEAQFIQLLADSVTGIHWWVLGILWVSMLTGSILGALGGLLAGPGGRPDPEMTLIYQVVGISGMLTSGLMLIITTAVLAQLGPATAKSTARLGLIPAYPPDVIIIFPVITIFLMMFDSLWLWWFFYRQGQAAGQEMDRQVRLSAMTLFGTPIVSMALIFLFYRQPLYYSLYLPFFLVAILASTGILRHVWKNSSNAWVNNLTPHTTSVSALLGLMIIGAGAYFSTIPAALGDIMLVVTMIASLTPGGKIPSDLTSMMDLVRNHYVIYRNTGLLVILVILPVFTLIVGSLVLWALRFASRNTKHISKTVKGW